MSLDKHSRRSFSKGPEKKATKPLQFMYIDVCRLINPPSFGKNICFLLFIDDFSRKTWVYFLK